MSYVFNCQPSASKDIICQDKATGIYKDKDGTWYLNDGTPLDDFDPNSGAYSEGGSWYTYQGITLSSYDKTSGAYQEVGDTTWYDKNGNVVNPNAQKPKASPLKPTPNYTPLYIGLGIFTIAIVSIIIAIKKKK